MAPAPIVVKCECGVETRGRSGDVIRCTGCGLRYDTGEQAKMLDTVRYVLTANTSHSSGERTLVHS